MGQEPNPTTSHSWAAVSVNNHTHQLSSCSLKHTSQNKYKTKLISYRSLLNPRQHNPAPLHGIVRPLGRDAQVPSCESHPVPQPVINQSLFLATLFVAHPSATKGEVLLAPLCLSQAVFLPSECAGWATRQGGWASTPSEEAQDLGGKEPCHCKVYLLFCHWQ